MADLQEINMTKATDMNNKKVRLVGDDGKGYWMEKEDLAQVVGGLLNTPITKITLAHSSYTGMTIAEFKKAFVADIQQAYDEGQFKANEYKILAIVLSGNANIVENISNDSYTIQANGAAFCLASCVLGRDYMHLTFYNYNTPKATEATIFNGVMRV